MSSQSNFALVRAYYSWCLSIAIPRSDPLQVAVSSHLGMSFLSYQCHGKENTFATTWIAPCREPSRSCVFRNGRLIMRKPHRHSWLSSRSPVLCLVLEHHFFTRALEIDFPPCVLLAIPPCLTWLPPSFYEDWASIRRLAAESLATSI